ncbi:MAG: ABC transporter permease [Acidimicrobiales bacterium]
MRRVTLRSLWEHKRRMVSTVVAVVLGVAFMSGTFVLADTLDKVFDDLFAEYNENVDAQVQGQTLFSSEFGGDFRARLDESLVDNVRPVDGVRAAEPFAITFGFGSTNRILDADGDTVGASQGPPTLIESWIDDEAINPYVLADGRGPEADDEIALNVAAADDGDFSVGDTVALVSQFGRSEYTLVGTVRFGTADSSAGAVSAELMLAEVQRIAGAQGQIDNVLVEAEDGVSPDELVGRIAPVLPAAAEVITGEEAADQLSDSVTEGFQFFAMILTVFGAIALVVATFIISNTFAILIAQRTRELALLRAVGASRGQVLRSVLLEAVVIGLLAAVLGLLGGVALAAGITALLRAIGVDLPTAGLVVSLDTVVVALVVGLVVTMVAAVIPAIRATRVPPLAALRDVAFERVGASRLRIALGVVVILVAVLLLSRAWTADGDTEAIPTVGLGALLFLVGAIVVGPLLAGPSVRFLGSALPRLKGITGQLATENAARSPKRTSATASALLIGVTLVGFVTIFAASAKTSVASEVDRALIADLVVQSDTGGFGGFSGFPTQVADRVAEVDGVEHVDTFAFAEAQFTYPDGGRAQTFLSAIDPATITRTLVPRMEEGDITELSDDGIVVDQQIASRNDVSIGDPIHVVVPGGGSLDLTVEGLSDDVSMLGFWTISRAAYQSVVPEQLDLQVYATLSPGADLATVQAAVEEAVEASGVPAIDVFDREAFKSDIANQLTGVLNFIYGLLGLSIVIAVIGIANTLSLSIHERTRELGLLRAVGMTRNQVRSAVRWEAVIIAVLGTLVGLAVGLVLSRALLQAMEGFGLTKFSLPIRTLAVITVLAGFLGVFAARRPAKRAAKLNVLEAIATE